VELADDFGSYVGWVAPFGVPVALVLPAPERDGLQEAVTQLLRVGYERVAGVLAGGIEAWARAGLPLAAYGTTDVDELCRAYRSGAPPAVLDVRQRTEWDAGRIPGSRHVFVGDLPGRLGELPADREQWAICATGHRASIAASLLDAAGIPVRLVARGGVEDWLRLCLAQPEMA
jgi:rhodanese-related sulfurtransferase